MSDGDFAAAPHNRARGSAAESAAAAWLAGCGYRVLERNVSTAAGEIDLVALHRPERDAETLCFIEVKARASHRFGPGIAAVDARKQRRLARAAALYLAGHPWRGPCRFDVLGLDPGPEGWAFTLVQDAFRLGP